MEDYTYNLVPGKEGILETHMLEICPSIADGDVNIRVNPLGLGNREDPARLVFTAKEGDAIASVIAVPANEEEEPAVLDGAGAPESESEENVSKEQ